VRAAIEHIVGYKECVPVSPDRFLASLLRSLALAADLMHFGFGNPTE
jgi:hypothetical protein